MATYTFNPVPAWGAVGQFARIGAAKSKAFPVTIPAGTPATVVQGGVTKVGYIESDGTGFTAAFTTTDIPSVVIDFGVGQVTVHSLEAISAGASSAASAANSATAAQNSANDAAASAASVSAASTAIAGKVDKGTIALYAKDYGAVGDGITDDTSAIQSALSAARAAKAALRFEYGKTYVVSGTLNPLGVRVEGFGATLRSKAGVPQTWNTFQSSGACTIVDLTIDLNKANTTDPGFDTQCVGIYIATTSAGYAGTVVLRNVRVINGYQVGIRVASSTSVTDASTLSAWSSAIIDGCFVDSCKWGVWVKGVRGVTLRDVQVTNSASDGMYDYASRDTQVIGGRTIGNGRHGFVSQYGYETGVHGLEATGNVGSGITFGGGSTTITEGKRFNVTGCTANNNTDNGIILDPTKTGAGAAPVAVYASLSGNVTIGNGVHGIYLNNAKAVSVTGNSCHDQTAGAGVAVSSHSVALAGNVCTGNLRGIALYGNASFPNYGSHRVGLNVVTGNTSSTYYVESASVTGLKFAAYSATAPE